MNKEIVNNKWVKVGIVSVGIASIIGVVIYVLKKRNDKKKLTSLINSAQKEIGTNTAVNNNTTTQNNSVGLINSYTANSFTANNKIYTFEKSGIVKLQKYFSEKDSECKKLIAESGGTDGIIGKAFVTCLNILSKKMPLVNTLAYTYIKSLFALAKLTPNEFSIK